MNQLEHIESVFFVGIGGIGMSALARYCIHQNRQVYGYDKTASPLTGQLEKEGIVIQFIDEIESLPLSFKSYNKKQWVVITPAVPKDNQILNHLIELGYEPIKRSAFLGLVAQSHYTIAIGGTHGKTTTSTLLAHIVYEAGYNMLGILGGIATNYSSNYVIRPEGKKMNGKSILITEADEFDRSFLHLHPNIGVITSTDADHLDIYGKEDELRLSFQAFANQVKDTLVLNEDVEIDHKDLVKYGSRVENQYSNLKQINGAQYFDGVVQGIPFKEQRAGLAGEHNIENAMAALVSASIAGIDLNVALKAVASFKGVKRRFERVFETRNKLVLDDYAHHPAELNALISAIRTLYPHRELNLIFQPHLYSRTSDFMDDFALALAKVDSLIIIPIYPAREKPIEGITSQALLKKVNMNKKLLMSKESTIEWAALNQPDLLVIAGAGDIDRIVLPIVEAYKNEKSTQ